MLKLLVSEYFFFIPIITNLIIFWKIFFKKNTIYINKKNNWDRSLSIKNIINKNNPTFFIKIYIVFSLFFLLYLFIYNGFSGFFWWSHFKLNNFNIYIYILVTLFNLYFMYISDKHIKIINNYSIDYLFSLINISLFIPLIFLTNSLFTFFFLLEFISCTIFYKFISSKFNFKLTQNKDKFFSIFTKNYLNLLFYQYWSSFFSSIMLIFSIIYLFMLTGTTEWSIINFLINSDNQIKYFNNKIIYYIFNIIIIIGFIIKLGIIPIQFYKIEIYKSLPFLSIFFYTTFYFLNFFLYFSLFFLYYIISINYYYYLLLLLIILIGLFYIISLLFDINLIKSFLAYSTIINSVSFLLFILTIIF